MKLALILAPSPGRKNVANEGSVAMGKSMQRQRGSIAVLTAISLPVFLGFAALTIDLGYLFVIRNELQNAADSAALAGAGYFYQGTPMPNLDLGALQATNAISLNKSGGASLGTATVQSGYWNTTGSPSGLQSLPMTPGPNDLPAVMVKVSRSTGQNGGAVSLFFANIFGISSAPVDATAIAVMASPGYAGSSALFPLAITSCLFNNYWDATAKPPGPKNDPATGKPYVFDIGSAYHYAACSSGEWTSFDVDSNNVPFIKNLITNGNPTRIGVGDDIWVQPGTKTALYSAVNSCSAAGDKSCEYVTVPVLNNLDTHAFNPVVAFACIHIDLAVGGSGKYVQVEMTNSGKCKALNSGGVGPAYGAKMPPRLVQ